jgi:hypothetical protein
MAEMSREGLFSSKYQGVDKIWSGPSFIQYHDFKTLLAELPISGVAKTHREFSRRFPGNLEYVYGEMLYSLTGFEGYLRDKGFRLEECFIRPIFDRTACLLEFDIRYRDKEGQEVTRPAVAVRLGETSYIFYTDYYRPM